MAALAIALGGVVCAVIFCQRRPAVALAGATLAGIAVRLYRIGGPSFWLDETLTAWVARPASLVEALARHREAIPGSPLYYVLAWAAARLSGPAECTLRIPSVFLGLCAVGATFGMVREALAGQADARAGLVAGALVIGLSRTAVITSLDARPFALSLACAVASTWALARLLRTGASWAVAIAYAASAAALFLSNWFMAPFLAAQLLVAGYGLAKADRAGRRVIVIALGVAALLALPALGKLRLDLDHAARYDWTSAGHPPSWWRIFVDPALALALLALPIARRGRVAGALLVATVVMVALLRPNLLVERYLCYLVAPATTLVGLAVAHMAPRARPAAIAVVGLALLAPIAYSLARYDTAKDFRTEERWRDALATLDTVYRPGDLLLLRSGLVEEDALFRGDAALARMCLAPLGPRAEPPATVRARSLTFTFDPGGRRLLAGARFILARDEDGYLDRLLEGVSPRRDRRFGSIRLVELSD
jgi:hypothetical protein